MQPTFVNADLVLLGGGHAHVEVLRRLAMRPLAGVRVTLVSREIETPYSGMLPGLVAGHYRFEEAHIDLAPLAQRAGARLLHDEVIGLDLAARRVLLRERPPLAYDWLSIDTGSAPSLAVPGAVDRVLPVKPVSSFHRRWEALLGRVLGGGGNLRIGVVGGGAGGVELLLAARERLRRELAARHADPAGPRFTLVAAGEDILPGHGARARRLCRAALAAAGVELHLGSAVTAVDARGVTTVRGTHIPLDEVLWVTQAAAPAWPAAAGLATTPEGFIRVDASLRSISHPRVFAAGDVAHVDPYPRPKAGVYAVRQGPPLARNLARALAGGTPRAFRPQRVALSLIGTGDRHAIASRGAFAWAGDWVWRWKVRIDRRFMARYAMSDGMLPRAPVPAETTADDAAMRCGGCGAKLGAALLHEALDGLAQPRRADVPVGLDAPDDAAIVALPAGHFAVQTVDQFRSFIDDPWLFGRIAANHCLGDVFAMGAVPQTALALATLPLARPDKMRDELALMMGGALELLRAEGVALVGGHTAEGAELSLGFAVNGHVAPAAMLRKRGAAAGDALVLVKPLGTGVLLAAHMRARARWRWLESAFDSMVQSNGPALGCLRRHGVRALTDVTGFGLAGHLLEMLDDEALAARVSLAALPVLDGAAEAAREGLLSSLYPDNLRAARAAGVDDAARGHPFFDLCFDPQTAGGLLAAVPREHAAGCLEALRAAGYPRSAVIGEFRARAAGAARVLLEA